jgi:type II secretory pathway component PulJ
MIYRKSRLDMSGLTLVELMMAVALVATGFVLLLGALPSIHGTISTSSSMSQALHQAVTVLEEVRALPTRELEAYVPPALNDLGMDEVITVTILDWAGNEVTLPVDFSSVAGGVPDPVEVRVRVQWTDESGRPKTTTVATKKQLLTS